MKTEQYQIYQWTSTDPDLDIDWPRVHQELGVDCVRWLNQQPLDQCQLVVERHGNLHTLTAEFYCRSSYTKFMMLKH